MTTKKRKSRNTHILPTCGSQCHAPAQVSTCNWDIWVLETRGSRLQSRKWLSYINVFTFLPSGSSNNFCDRQIIWWQHWFKDVNMILFPAGFVFMSLEERWTSSQITNWEIEKDLLEKEPVKKKSIRISDFSCCSAINIQHPEGYYSSL